MANNHTAFQAIRPLVTFFIVSGNADFNFCAPSAAPISDGVVPSPKAAMAAAAPIGEGAADEAIKAEIIKPHGIKPSNKPIIYCLAIPVLPESFFNPTENQRSGKKDIFKDPAHGNKEASAGKADTRNIAPAIHSIGATTNERIGKYRKAALKIVDIRTARNT